MKEQRDINLDLIRCAAVILVLNVHFINNSGFIGPEIRGFWSFTQLIGWLLASCCVPLFLMLSGYLCGSRKCEARHYIGCVKFYVPYLFISLLCLLYDWKFRALELNLEYIVGSIVNFYGCGYAWYLMLYFGLFLMMPFINSMYHAQSTRWEKRILIFVFFALGVLPSLLNSYVQLYSVWWKNLYPLPYYLLGMYFREYPPRVNPRKAALLGFALLLLFGVYDVFYFKRDSMMALTIAYEHYQTYTLSIFIFVTLFNVRLPESKHLLRCISKVSVLSLLIFQFSWISDGFVYPRFVQLVPEYAARYKLQIPTVAVSFAMALVMSLLLYPISSRCETWLRKILHRLWDSVKPKLMGDCHE